jgi:hypothetical protein
MNQFGVRATVRIVVDLVADIGRRGFLTLQSRLELAAENLFLRKQLPLRQAKPRRADDASRIVLVVTCWCSSSRTLDARECVVPQHRVFGRSVDTTNC